MIEFPGSCWFLFKAFIGARNKVLRFGGLLDTRNTRSDVNLYILVWSGIVVAHWPFGIIPRWRHQHSPRPRSPSRLLSRGDLSDSGLCLRCTQGEVSKLRRILLCLFKASQAMVRITATEEADGIRDDEDVEDSSECAMISSSSVVKFAPICE